MRSMCSIGEFRAALRSDPDSVAARLKAGEIGLRHAFETTLKAAEGAERAFDFTISTASVDRQGDTISLDGWKLDSFRKNPVVLWAHDYAMLPVGRAENLRIADGGLMARAVFTGEGLSRFNDTVFEMLKTGFLSATSVGFIPLKWQWTEAPDRQYGIDFIEQELLEFSIVPVPANSEALIAPGQRAAADSEHPEPWLRGIAARRIDIRRAR